MDQHEVANCIQVRGAPAVGHPLHSNSPITFILHKPQRCLFLPLQPCLQRTLNIVRPHLAHMRPSLMIDHERECGPQGSVPLSCFDARALGHHLRWRLAGLRKR